MSDRLELLRPYLSRYNRRFSVLDFGAGINIPAIGTEIAKEFDAVVVCVEKDITFAQIESAPHVLWLKRQFDSADLQRMLECERFDVVIGCNIFHWFGKEWFTGVDTFRRMGHFVFVQAPTPDETNAVETFGYLTIAQLDSYFRHSGWAWNQIGETVQFPGHPARPLWMFERLPEPILTRTNVDAHDNSASTVFDANFEKCRAMLKKSNTLWQDWIQGINLYNFLRWGGVWPTRERIVDQLRAFPLPDTNHGDITPHNFIIDGERLHLIDGFSNWGGDDKECLQATIESVLTL